MSSNMEMENQKNENPEERKADTKKSTKGERRKSSNTFMSNSKYYTISVYTIITVLACALIIRSIFMWEATRASIVGVIRWCYPYLLGFFIAAMLYPMTVFFEKNLFDRLPDPLREKKRGLSIAVSYLLFIGIIVMLLLVIIPHVWDSLKDMASALPIWYRQFSRMALDLNEKLPDINLSGLIAWVQDFGNKFLSNFSLEKRIQEILMTVVSTSFSVVTVFLDLFITLIMSLYVLIDLPRIQQAAVKVLSAFNPEERTEKIIRISGECYLIFSRYVSGKLLDSIIIGVICFVAMNLLQLPYALVISAVVGITNMIPYFGPFIGAVPGAMILLMVSPVKMLIYVVLILVLQQFDGLYLGPKILGDSTGLRPAWIIFSVAAGGAVAGVMGMFIGVPVVAVIGHLINLFLDWKLDRKKG
ncbi:MAG: AI-2E family transporter [Lachnospiraceae bacterium]